MANCLLVREQKILDCSYLFYIHQCFVSMLKHLDDSRRQFVNYDSIDAAISRYQPLVIHSVQSMQTEGGGIYFENLLLELNGSVDVEYTSENLAKTIEYVLSGYLQQFGFLTAQDVRQLSHQAINILVFQNRQAHQKIFNPKPSWFLASSKYDEATTALIDQIHSIKRCLLELRPENADVGQLKEMLQEHCSLTVQLIGALFLQGQYKTIMHYVDRYGEMVAGISFLDQPRREKQIQKFSVGIAHLMVLICLDDDAKMKQWLNLLPREQEQVRLLCSAITLTRAGSYDEALGTTRQLYALMDRQIQTTIQENYQRSYEYFVVLVQVLHLQQVIQAKTSGLQGRARLGHVLRQQTQRLMNIYPNVDYWQMLTKIRHILGADADEEEILVEYALLCVKNKRSSMAREILIDLLGEAPINNFRIHKSPQQQYFVQSDNFDVAIPEARCANPSVVYAYSKLLLASGKVENQIAGYVHLLRLLGNQKVSGPFLDKVIVKILRCIDYFSNRQNVYQIQDDVQYKSLVNQSVTNVIESYSASVTSDVLDPSEVTTSSTYSRSDYTNVAPDKNMLVGMVVSDITCQLGHPPPPGSPNCPLSGQLVGSLFEQSKAEFWLPVTPQLLSYAALGARVHQPDPALAVRLQLRAGASAGRRRVVLHRRRGAAGVREDDRHLAAEQRAGRGAARLLEFNQELARTAQSLHEISYDALQYCIQQLNQGADPQSHLRFFDAFAELYQQLVEAVAEEEPDYQTIQTMPLISRAWDVFKQTLVYRSPSLLQDVKSLLIDASCSAWDAISAQTVLDLQQVSSQLLNLRNSGIPLPGVQYQQQRATLHKVVPRLAVIPSKQRPRKIAFLASDGEVYCYLLKGKEDLRQDERVMQFLRFADCQVQFEQIKVHAYPVFPLTNASGLIFWVPNTNSLQKLKQNDYDMQIQPDSLRRALFQLSQNSEDFISARSRFTRTYAAACATGHILGLGDRHPGNILLNEGREVVHIDYGDCFEIAQQREKYPEKTVFRLTAMVEAAFDVCGRAGLFSVNLRKVLGILRSNRFFIQNIFKGYLDAPKFAVLSAKLQGREKWSPDVELSVEEQAAALVQSATNVENLAQAYFGWAPFW